MRLTASRANPSRISASSRSQTRSIEIRRSDTALAPAFGSRKTWISSVVNASPSSSTVPASWKSAISAGVNAPMWRWNSRMRLPRRLPSTGKFGFAYRSM